MDFTKKFVKAKNPCADGFRWFLRNYRDGGNYQELLDALVEEGRVNDACWLLNQFGPTDAVRVVDAIDAQAMVFAGSLHVRGSVEVDCLVRAGRSLQVDGGIRAGFGQVAGVEHGIFVGDQLRVDGGVFARGPVRVGDDMRFGWGVDVDGDLQCAGDLRARWGLDCSGAATIGGNLQLGRDLTIEGDLRCERAIQVGGFIQARGQVRAGHGILAAESITCAMHLEAGWGIKAGAAIQVEGSIQAGEGVSAGEQIETGSGYGLFAGLAVHVDSWETGARVAASNKPDRLMSGWWAGPAAL